jgi:hypothetical protein
MSFLDGVLKPGQGAELAVIRELELRRKQWTEPGYFYRGVGDFLLQHGRFWSGSLLPEQYEQYIGPSGNCYENALAAAEADPSLRYVEGVYAIVGKDFHGHAWCIDPDDRLVELTVPTDPAVLATLTNRERIPWTLPERWGYFGAVLNTGYVRAHRDAYAEENGLAMFDLRQVEEARQRELAMQVYGVDPGPDYARPSHWPIFKRPFDPNRSTL